MNRRVLVRIRGDAGAVLQQWQPPAAATVNRTPDFIDVILADRGARPALEALKSVVRALPAQTVTLVPFFQASDFTAADLEAAPALEMRVFGGPTLSAAPIVDETICGTCGEPTMILRPIDRIVATTSENVAGVFLDAGNGGVLARRDFVQSLHDAALTKGLATMPASITGRNGTSEEYVLIRGTVSLGYYSGHVLYGPPCPECGRPPLLERENFLQTFAPAEPFDFAHSEVDGPLSLFISHDVYAHLIRTVPDRDTLMFEPIEFAPQATVGRVH